MVRLADIAQKTGYSINTVSHALNNKPDISDTTKEYICRIADEMGYVRNYSASSLRSGKTHSIAIIIGDISNPLFAIQVKEIEQTLRKNGYNAFVFNTDEDEQLEREAIISAISKCVDGILICPTQKSTANIELMTDKKIPFVLFGRYFENLDTNYVVLDDECGGYQAAMHLINQGHKDILFINTFSHISSAKQRLKGIQKAYAQTNTDLKHLKTVDIVATSNFEVIQKAMKDSSNCTAIICFSDFFALSATSVCWQKGQKIPDDIAIVGFDDISSAMCFPVPLTSVTSSDSKMTHIAVDALLKSMDNPKEKHKYVLPTKLVERASTK